jgi:uncharacterized protein DUF4189
MDRIVSHGAVLLMALSLGANPAAADRKLTRSVASGVETIIDSARASDRDCNPLPVAITIVSGPANGVVLIKDGSKTIPASPLSGTAEHCAGMIGAKQIMYRSNPGYFGGDMISYDIVYGATGEKFSFTVAIDVAATAPAALPAAPQTSAPAVPGASTPPAPQISAAAGHIGAVAAGTCDRLGYAVGFDNLSAASAAALQACASNGDKSCKVILPIQGNCAAFAVAGPCGARGWANGSDRRQAELQGLGACASQGGQGCTVRRSICDGED